MRKIRFDFVNEKIDKDWDGHTGIEHAPGLSAQRAAILCALGVQDQVLTELLIDFDEGISVPDLGIRDIPQRADAVLSAAGYSWVDMSNTVGLIDAYINGQIPSSLFDKLFELERNSGGPDSDITQFLKMLIPPG